MLPVAARAATSSVSRRSLGSLASLASDVKSKLSQLESRKTPKNTKPLPPKKKPTATPTPHAILKHREAMKENFPDGWNPPRKLSRDAMDGLRALHLHNPEQFNTPALAAKFRISPEAVRRILKSKWHPSEKRRSELISRERVNKLKMRLEQRRKEWEEAKQLKDNPAFSSNDHQFDLR